jgi:hypothetical protein
MSASNPTVRRPSRLRVALGLSLIAAVSITAGFARSRRGDGGRPEVAQPEVTVTANTEAPSSAPPVERSSTTTTEPTTLPTTATVTEAPPAPAFPNASSTGVDADAALVLIESRDRPLIVTEDLDGISYTGTIEIGADDVTISNSRIVATTLNAAIWNRNGHSNVTVRDSTIICFREGEPGAAGVAGIQNVLGNDISGCADGIKAGSGSLSRGNYIHDLGFGEATHNDGIQIQAGDDIRIVNNTIITYTDDPATKQANAGVFAQAESGPITRLTVANNFVDGFGFSLRIRGERLTGAKIVDNVIGLGHFFGALLVDGGAENPANNNLVGNNYRPDGSLI